MKLLLIITFLWPVFQPNASCPEKRKTAKPAPVEQTADINLLNPFIIFNN